MKNTSTTLTSNTDKRVGRMIIALSVIVPLAVAGLFLIPESMKLELGINAGMLPLFHALLNGTTAVLLILGLLFIKGKKMVLHQSAMVSAFALSAVFLVSYVVSHLSSPDAKFGGEGAIRYVYFFILISHILLSIPVLPLAMFAIYRGWTNNIAKHKKVVRFAFPIWLYVAITGVLVYIFMQPYY